MNRVVICAFRSPADAEAAHASLLERGFGGDSVALVPGGRHDDRAAAAWVARTFGGRLDPERLARYEMAVDDGLSLVVVQATDDAATRRAAAVLDQCGRKARTAAVPETAASLGAALDSEGGRGGEGGPPVFDLRDTITRPHARRLFCCRPRFRSALRHVPAGSTGGWAPGGVHAGGRAHSDASQSGNAGESLSRRHRATPD